MPTRLLALAAAGALAFGLGACGDGGGSDDPLPAAIPAGATDTGTTASADTATTAAPEPASTKITRTSPIKISTDVKKKPKIPKPTGTAPTDLVAKDIVKGTGPAAKAGDQVSMDYVGVLYKDAKQFDASWDRGQPYDLTLGQGNVIQGWDLGIVGMRKGGRRLLVIPPDLAYGDQGQGDIGPNEPLVFVVDLKKLTAG